MAKKGQKILEIFWGASHIINKNIFNIFCFSTFSLRYFPDPIFRAIFFKLSQNSEFVKYPREKVIKQKMLTNVVIYHMGGPQKYFKDFWPFFGHFYPISLEKLAISPKTRTPQFARNQILTPTGK